MSAAGPYCRRAALAAGLAATAALAGCADFSHFRALRISSASASQLMCSAAFVSGLDPERAYREELRPMPGMWVVDWALRSHVDRERREVVTTIAGRARSRAVFREGLGCTIAFGELPAITWSRPADRPWPPDPFPGLAAPALAGDAAAAPIRAAIDEAFAEPEQGPARRTQAIVVVHRGRILGERYAPDVGPDTPLPGHSISKSVTHALVGILARDGRLDADAPAPVPAWRSSGDPRARITPNALLAMSSGLPWDERRGGYDESTRMWFDEPDPYAYSTSVDADAAPGTRWGYSNLGYAVLSRLVRDAAGGSAQAALEFAQRELFDATGMRRTTLSIDATGTPQGSSQFFASARDWARFGLLYLGDGVAGGRRVLPEGWVAAARVPTLDAGYGRGFWLNSTDAPHPLPGRWGMAGAPADAYFARGVYGQFVVIVPSRDLVVVRLGISMRPGGDIAGVGRLVARVVDTIDRAAAAGASPRP